MGGFFVVGEADRERVAGRFVDIAVTEQIQLDIEVATVFTKRQQEGCIGIGEPFEDAVEGNGGWLVDVGVCGFGIFGIFGIFAPFAASAPGTGLRDRSTPRLEPTPYFSRRVHVPVCMRQTMVVYRQWLANPRTTRTMHIDPIPTRHVVCTIGTFVQRLKRTAIVVVLAPVHVGVNQGLQRTHPDRLGQQRFATFRAVLVGQMVPTERTYQMAFGTPLVDRGEVGLVADGAGDGGTEGYTGGMGCRG